MTNSDSTPGQDGAAAAPVPSAANCAERLRAGGFEVLFAEDRHLPRVPEFPLPEPSARVWISGGGGVETVAPALAEVARLSEGTTLVIAPDSRDFPEFEARLGDLMPVTAVAPELTGPARSARCLLATLDSLHHPLLLHHDRWLGFWEHLRLVVLHDSSGLVGCVGSHAYWLLRRVERMVEQHEARPAWLVADAALANPVEHLERLLGPLTSRVVAEDSGEKGPLVVATRADEEEALQVTRAATLLGQPPSDGADDARWAPTVRGWSLGDEVPRAGVHVVGPALASFIRGRSEVFSRPGRRWGHLEQERGGIRRDELLAAAAELSLIESDDDYFGDGAYASLAPFEGRLVQGVKEGEPEEAIPAWRYVGWEPADVLVQPSVVEREPFRVMSTGRRAAILGSLHRGAVALLAHPGAIIHLDGAPWSVTALDLDEAEIRVRPENVRAVKAGRATRPICRRLHQVQGGPARPTSELGLQVGVIRVLDAVTAYGLTPTAGRPEEPVALEPELVVTYETMGAWMDLPPRILRDLAHAGFYVPAVLASVARTVAGWLAWRAGTRTTGQILVTPYTSHAQLDGGGIFIHEDVPGGAGMARCAAELWPDLSVAMTEALHGCRCLEGCDRCIPSVPQGRMAEIALENSPHDRAGAAVFFALLEGTSAPVAMARLGGQLVGAKAPRVKRGSRVLHPELGPGRVLAVTPESARVLFSGTGIRTVLLNCLGSGA